MTVQGELAKPNAALEWILCIQGVGWPADDVDLSSGFDGDVFVTADLNGDLATQLGCTIHKTLEPRSDIDYQAGLNSPFMEYGGGSFNIIDTDGFWKSIFVPNITPTNTDTLSSQLDYADTDVVLVDGTFSANDVIYIADREAIKLGSKTGGGPYTYSSSTRGYLGTRRGAVNLLKYGASMMSWRSDPDTGLPGVTDKIRLWKGRLMRMYLHVPGEAPTNCLLMWQGKLTRAVAAKAGLSWSISGAGDLWGEVSKVRVAPTFKIRTDKTSWAEAYAKSEQDRGGSLGGVYLGNVEHARRALTIDLSGGDRDGYGMFDRSVDWMSSFHYRPTVNGTSGLNGENALQALTRARATGDIDSASGAFQLNGSLLMVQGTLVRMLHRTGGFSNLWWNQVEAEMSATWAGVWEAETFTTGMQCRVMLDNFLDDYELSRFQINRNVTRNPIDILLMFMMSGGGEFFRGTVAASPSPTATTFTVSGSPGWATDMWAGASVYFVDNNNAFYSRQIKSNTADAITLEEDAPNTPASGDNFQIRNTQWDTLPVSWGLGVPYQRIDVPTWIAFRQTYFAAASTSRWAIGKDNKLDKLKFLQKEILGPHNIMVYLDPVTGKYTPRYIGAVEKDGITQTYTQVNKDQIRKVSDVDYSLGSAVGKLEIQTRGAWKSVVDYNADEVSKWYRERTTRHLPDWTPEIVQTWDFVANPTINDGPKATITILPGKDVEQAYHPDDAATVRTSAMLYSTLDYEKLIPYLTARIKDNHIPKPVVTLTLDADLFPDVFPGKIVNVEFRDIPNNPYDTADGWNDISARILTMKFSAMRPEIICKCKILDTTTNPAFIAPACDLEDFTDASPDWYEVYSYRLVPGYTLDETDWKQFTVGDLVEHRNQTGVVQYTSTIESFGDNQVSDPDSATFGTAGRMRINVNTHSDAAGCTVTAGDYLTFQAWHSTNSTAQMKKHFALADANETLGGDSEDAKDYV